MVFSPRGINLLKSFESLRLKAYKDSAGIWTIGWGTILHPDGNPVRYGDIISPEEAERDLMYEYEGIADKLNILIKVPLIQYQFDSLVCFCYNVGVPGFKTSTLLKAINDKEEVKEDYFARWDKAHIDGKLVEIPGLLSRRRKEFQLFIGNQ